MAQADRQKLFSFLKKLGQTNRGKFTLIQIIFIYRLAQKCSEYKKGKNMAVKTVLCLIILAVLSIPVLGAGTEECSSYQEDELEIKLGCYKKKADLGNANAQNILGTMYVQSKGVKQDYFEAMKWFRKSAKQGNSDAQLNLGVMYANGFGVTLNDRLAYQWFLKSAESGNKKARHYIVKLLLFNKDDPLSVVRDGDTALRIALLEGNKELLKILTDKGVKFDQDNENLLILHIKGMGPSGRFTIEDIRPTHDGPGGRFTLSQEPKHSGTGKLDVWEANLEKADDFIPITNNKPIIDADGTLIRFKGEVIFKEHVFKGSVSDPIAFYLTKDYGLVYLRGEGTVLLKSGEKVTLNSNSSKADKRIIDYKRNSKKRSYMADSSNKVTNSENNLNVNIPSSLPDNGHVFFKQSDHPIAPLEIVTKNQNYHYYVKVSEANSNKTVETFFLRSGGTVKTKLPLGTYIIKYATGQTWYGEDKLFGKDTQYNKTDRTFRFTRNKDQITGFRIELILRKHGNLSTSKITKEEW